MSCLDLHGNVAVTSRFRNILTTQSARSSDAAHQGAHYSHRKQCIAGYMTFHLTAQHLKALNNNYDRDVSRSLVNLLDGKHKSNRTLVNSTPFSVMISTFIN